MVNEARILGHVFSVTPQETSNSPTKLVVKTVKTYTNANGEQTDTQYHNIVVWGKRAAWVGDNTRKGDFVYITGFLKTSSYTTKNGDSAQSTSIQVSTIDNFTYRAEKENKGKPKPPEQRSFEPGTDYDEELPF